MDFTQEQIKEIILSFASGREKFIEFIKIMLDSFMYHERALYVDEKEDEQCNGFRYRDITSNGFTFSLRIPRSRSGNFQPIILGLIKKENEEKAKLFNLLYTKGLTTEEIGEISESIYGRTYSKQQVSYLSNHCRKDVESWFKRKLSSHYLVVYIDATFINTRRGSSVSKEAYYTILGVNEDGRREVLSIKNYPTEGAFGWEEVISELKERGVEKIDLFVSDGLAGIENSICKVYPNSSHQLCVTHLKRQIINNVNNKDKNVISQELLEVFARGDNNMNSLQGYKNFITFVEKWEKKYPHMKKYKNQRNIAYFTYMDYNPEVQKFIYTTNWIERLNRDYKRTIKMRTSMPSPESVLFLLGSVAIEATESRYNRIIPQFKNWRKLNNEYSNRI